MTSRTLITGAPGWLGNRLAESLSIGASNLSIFAKHPERETSCLISPGSDTTDLQQLPVTLVAGDLRKPESLHPAVEGIDTIIHAAGVIHPKRLKHFYDLNTDGTRNLLKAAAEAKVQRFIYISANSAAGHQSKRSTLRS